MNTARRLALAAIAVLVATASLTSFAESYRGLYVWSSEHGLNGLWAVAWPLQVDVFIAVGELALFVGLADQWTRRNRVGAWTVTLAGLAVSVAGNVGHVSGHALASRATAAVPPLAAAAALAVGLGVLKRVTGAPHKGALAPLPVAPLPVAPLPVAEPAVPERLPEAAVDVPGRDSHARGRAPLTEPHPVLAEPVPAQLGSEMALPVRVGNGHAAPERGREAAQRYADDLRDKNVPPVKRIGDDLRVGQVGAETRGDVRAFRTQWRVRRTLGRWFQDVERRLTGDDGSQPPGK
ncbi:MAG TPA: DUF2637 domain-containing protein [Streptosporangiaceae bacterium]|nr:DUF2637 domain-containing protein [Streptosporangiaceae bacterium]